MWVCISLLLSYLDIIGPTGSDRLTQGKVGTGEEVEFSGLDWVPPAQCITTTKTNNTEVNPENLSINVNKIRNSLVASVFKLFLTEKSNHFSQFCTE